MVTPPVAAGRNLAEQGARHTLIGIKKGRPRKETGLDDLYQATASRTQARRRRRISASAPTPSKIAAEGSGTGATDPLYKKRRKTYPHGALANWQLATGNCVYKKTAPEQRIRGGLNRIVCLKPIAYVKGVRFRIVNSLVVFRCCCESHGCLEHCVINIRVLFTTSWHAVMAAR